MTDRPDRSRRSESSARPVLLLVDDDPAVHEMLAPILTLEGFSVRSARTLEEALLSEETEACDLVLVDLSLRGSGGSEGFQLLAALRSRRPSLPVALFTARGSSAVFAEAQRLGAVDAWGKDAPITEMIRRLRRLAGGAQAQ